MNQEINNQWYDKKWLVLILCVFVFPIGLYALWKSNQFSKIIKIGITAIIIIILIGTLGSDDKNQIEDKNTALVKKEEITNKESASNNEHWSYSNDKDQMSGQARFFASCQSTNEIEFKFPYQGGSTFTLTVRNMGKGNEIMLQVSKGQFIGSIGSMEKLRVKFDEEPPINVSYDSPSDGSADVIFLNSVNKIIEKLKTSKKLMIEAEFFDEGLKIIYFDVEGLKWEN